MSPSRLASAAVLAAVLTTPAFAADLPDIVFEEPVPLPEPARFNWGGFYAGGHAGVVAGSVDPGIVGQKSMYENAFIGGAHVGVSAELAPMFVVGIEGDFDGSTYDETRVYGTSPVNSQIDWTASARGRFGLAFGQFVNMPGVADVQAYATGGLALAKIRAATPGYSDTNTHTGWTIGGGVEAAVTQNLTVRAEYLYTSYANELYGLGPTVGDLAVEARTNVVRGGISYYF